MKIPNIIMLALMTITVMFSTPVHAHRYLHRNHNNGWNSCDFGSCGQVARRHNHRSSGIDLLSDIFSVPIYMNTLLRQQEAQLDRMERSIPRYDISETEAGSYELTLEIPGVEAKDLSIELQGNHQLRVSGTRRYQQHGSTFESTFDQTFTLENVNIDELKVTLSAGILRISAPKQEKATRKLSIEEIIPESISVAKMNIKEDINVDDLELLNERSTVELDGLTISND